VYFCWGIALSLRSGKLEGRSIFRSKTFSSNDLVTYPSLHQRSKNPYSSREERVVRDLVVDMKIDCEQNRSYKK